MAEDIGIIHEELFELLVAFDQLCSECGVNYSLHGGTLIGAKRYGDFIPWDDDADVTVMSWDYEKIADYLGNHPENGFRFADDDGLGHRYTRIKLDGRVMGWIDVIEYNYITENRIGQKIRNIILIALSAMSKNKYHVKTATVKKHGYVQMSIFKTLYYLGYIFGKKNILKAHRYVSRNWFLGRKKLIQRTNDQVRALRRIMPKEYYADYEKVSMHGYNFMITKNYHDVLAQVYGENWMIPPRQEEQVLHETVVRDAYSQLQNAFENQMREKN